ncbi:4-(cytidine 5'-diphospho)-2-C-methyl-D-erythritol kinase [Sulfurimonas sp. MAG313]|nr:4-(cytidine 5'-diphospho)-2-C-methyl-D-erythritol kinase [Sulfurimonas sp. MAG313]MDF1881255.1 4-(cytidine 5'-diphospho)-2-C-methyl-D-erythritol kinase [Sulfurimonas sp. MAG313]
MGGFEGGDEGGFWDDEDLHTFNTKKIQPPHKDKIDIQVKNSIYSIKAYAKITIFLKITGYKDGHHTLLSRFMRVQNVYDTISIIPCTCETFSIEGCDNITLEENTIYKAYKALLQYTNDSDIEDFFYEHKVIVKKRIPMQADLGGGSSDAASFMHLVKEMCNLLLSVEELAQIGRTIGEDMPFFIYNYTSANVSGFGEIVEAFEEEPLNIELYTPNIKYDTALVYKIFKEHFFLSSFLNCEKRDSRSILEGILDPTLLNDLYPAALLAYPDLKKEAKKNWFFSGSGSTFFKVL